MFEYPAAASLDAAKLQSRLEKVREQLSFHGEETERISLWLIEGNRAPVEREDGLQCFGNGVQEGLLSQVCDDGVVYLKQKAVLLFTHAECRFRLFPFRNIDKGNHRAQGLTVANDIMGPKLHGKARAVLSPINLVVPVDVLVFLEANIDGTFFNRI